MTRLLAIALLACACVRVPSHRADAMIAEPKEPLGEDRLSFKWKFITADRRTEVTPQEFAAAAVYADTLYIGSARGWFYALRAANGLPAPATTRLVTNLRVLGYTFNPVSFFLDYDARGQLASAIAEVNNTYGGRFRYVLGPAQRMGGERAAFRHVRELFVSPFLHGPATYDFTFDAPLDGAALAIEMHVHRDDRRLFTARLGGTRDPLSDRALAWAALRYPFMSAQVIGLIHFEALKMRLGGVPYRRPERDHRPLDAATR